MANPQRLRIVAELSDGRVHVSELARRLGMSRPLLYMHLDKLEKAGLVAGRLELSVDGKAMKYISNSNRSTCTSMPKRSSRRCGKAARKGTT